MPRPAPPRPRERGPGSRKRLYADHDVSDPMKNATRRGVLDENHCSPGLPARLVASPCFGHTEDPAGRCWP